MTGLAATPPGDKAAVTEGVIAIIRPYAKTAPEDLSPDTPLEKLGVDSFDFVEIIFKLEETYGIEIDYNVNSSFAQMTTVRSLVDEVARLVAAKSGA